MALTIAPALKTLWTLGKHGADVYKKLAAVDEDLFYVSRATEALSQPLALALRFRRRYATMVHVDAAVEMTRFTLEKCVKLLEDSPDLEDEQVLGIWLKNKVNNLSRQQHLQSLVPKLQLCQQSLLLAISSLQLQCARAVLAERAPFVFVEPAVDRAVAIAQRFRLGQSEREVVAAGQVYVWTESKTGGPPVWEDLEQNSVVLVAPKTQQTTAAFSGSPAQDAEERNKAIERLSLDPTDEQAKKVLRDEAQAVAGRSEDSGPWKLWLIKQSTDDEGDDTRILDITSETVLKRSWLDDYPKIMAHEEDGDRLIYELRGGDQRFVLVFDSIGIAAESFEALVALFSASFGACYVCILLFLIQQHMHLLRSLYRGLHASLQV